MTIPLGYHRGCYLRVTAYFRPPLEHALGAKVAETLNNIVYTLPSSLTTIQSFLVFPSFNVADL